MTQPPAPVSRRRFLSLSGSLGLGIAAAGVSSVVPRLHAANFRQSETSDRTVLTRAVAEWRARGGGVLRLEAGRTYDLGEVAPGEHIFDLRGLSRAVLEGNGARLRCVTAGLGKSQMFLVRQCRGLKIAGLQAEDGGADLREEWRGMDFVHLDSSAGAIADITLDNVAVHGAVSLLSCSGGPGSPRTSGITLLRTVARNCYYGLSFQENGDDVTGDITTINCRRSYFPYGVHRHNVVLQVSHDGIGPGADACILVKRYLQDTGDIKLRASFSGVLKWRNLLKLEMQPPAGSVGTISDVDVELDVAGSSVPFPGMHLVGLGTWRNGRYEAKSRDVWRAIRVSGCSGPVPRQITRMTAVTGGADVVLAPGSLRCA